MTTLPEGSASIDHSIASMDEGDRGWTMPWAMFHDDQRKLWLNGSYPIYPHRRGTAEMFIRRDAMGWHVDAMACANWRWGRGGFVGAFPPIAVASLKLA